MRSALFIRDIFDSRWRPLEKGARGWASLMQMLAILSTQNHRIFGTMHSIKHKILWYLSIWLNVNLGAVSYIRNRLQRPASKLTRSSLSSASSGLTSCCQMYHVVYLVYNAVFDLSVASLQTMHLLFIHNYYISFAPDRLTVTISNTKVV